MIRHIGFVTVLYYINLHSSDLLSVITKIYLYNITSSSQQRCLYLLVRSPGCTAVALSRDNRNTQNRITRYSKIVLHTAHKASNIAVETAVERLRMHKYNSSDTVLGRCTRNRDALCRWRLYPCQLKLFRLYLCIVLVGICCCSGC